MRGIERGVVRVTAPTGTAARPVALFVPSLGRSGTSALTRVLSLCGAALPADLLGATPSAPLGAWEPRAVARLNDSILRRHGTRWYDPSLRFDEGSALDAAEKAACVAEAQAFLSALPAAPLVVIKEGNVAVLSGVWFEAAHAAGFDTAAVLAVRHPEELIPSLAKHMQGSPELAAALWLKYGLIAERHTRGVPRVFVEYANLLDNWRREMKRISAALAVDLSSRDEGAIEEFIKPNLRHQQHGGPVTELFGTDWMSTLYEAQRLAAQDEPWDATTLDRVFEAYRASEHVFRTAYEDFHDEMSREMAGIFRFGPITLRLGRAYRGVR